MIRSIYLQTLYERRAFIIGWTIGLTAFAALMAVFFPAMRPENGMEALLESMPSAFQGLVGDMAALNSFDTYLATQLFDIRGSILIGIMAVILGVSLSTREEETGELRTLLAQPISRTRYLMEKWFAVVSIIALTTIIGLTVGIFLTAPFIEDAVLPLDGLLRTLAMTLLMMTTIGTVAFGVGFVTGKKSLATLVGTLVLALSFIIATFSAGVDWLKDIEFISLLSYFPAVDIMTTEIALRDVAVLGGATLAILLVSIFVFRIRDVA